MSPRFHHARPDDLSGKSVVRGVKRAMVIVDMPFGSYQGNELEGLASAIRIMKESHADASNWREARKSSVR